MSGTTPDPVEVAQIVAQLTDAMTGIQVCRFSNAAAAAIYVYGISTSISDEVRWYQHLWTRMKLMCRSQVKYFWSSFRWTFPNILYIINRYVCLWFFLILTWGTSILIRTAICLTFLEFSGLHGDFSDGFCKNPIGTVGIILAQLSWTGIMTLRVVALWKTRCWLVVFVWCLWLITMGGTATLIVLLYLGVTGKLF